MFGNILFLTTLALVSSGSILDTDQTEQIKFSFPSVFEPKLDKEGSIIWDEIEEDHEITKPELREWIFGEKDHRRFFFQMESPPEPFIGRVQEMAILKYVHLDNKYIVLTGEPGVGKTALARKYGMDFAANSGGSVIWINALTYTDMTSNFDRLAAQLHIQPTNKVVTLFRKICEYFTEHRVLFIFDDAKPDNEILKNIKYYADDNDNIRVLVTSRDDEWDPRVYHICRLAPFTNEEAAKYLRDGTLSVNEFISKEVSGDFMPRLDREMSNIPWLKLSKDDDDNAYVNDQIDESENAIHNQRMVEDYFQHLPWLKESIGVSKKGYRSEY